MSKHRIPFREGPHRGFTLIEVIIVITVTGILAGVLALIISGPIKGATDVQRRANLVGVADTALQRMSRELRLALPNSVRINSGNDCDTGVDGVCAVEFLRTSEGGRYRYGVDSLGAGDPLDFTVPNDSFDVFGALANPGSIDTGGTTQGACLAGTVDCLVIYNTGQTGANAYAGDNIAAIEQASLTFNNSGDLPGFFFPLTSPERRLFVVDTPVSFVCNPGQIHRHDGYTIASSQSTSPGGNTALLANQVTGCQFRYDPGTAHRGGLVTLRITVTDDSLGQSISLLQQAHVSNQP